MPATGIPRAGVPIAETIRYHAEVVPDRKVSRPPGRWRFRRRIGIRCLFVGGRIANSEMHFVRSRDRPATLGGRQRALLLTARLVRSTLQSDICPSKAAVMKWRRRLRPPAYLPQSTWRDGVKGDP
jgi:hypothetical protein